MNTLIKTVLAVAAGWLCYKFGDIKGSVCTSAFCYDDLDPELRDFFMQKGKPFRLNALASKLVRTHNGTIYFERRFDGEEEAD